MIIEPLLDSNSGSGIIPSICRVEASLGHIASSIGQFRKGV